MTYNKADIGIHNFSTRALAPQDMQLLRKGLSYCPTPNTPPMEMQQHILKQFDQFAKSLRLRCRYPNKFPPKEIMHTETSQIYRKIKFVPHNPQSFATAQYSGNSTIETFIYNTKEIAEKAFPVNLEQII